MSSRKTTIVENFLPIQTTIDVVHVSSSIVDKDEVKIFDYEKHEDDMDVNEDEESSRLSPVIKEEESLIQQATSINLTGYHWNCEQRFHRFFPYFLSSHYHPSNATQSFDKLTSLETLSKFMSLSAAHTSNINTSIDQQTDFPNTMYSLSSTASLQLPCSQHSYSPLSSFVFPTNYSLSLNSPLNSTLSLPKRSTPIRCGSENFSQQQSTLPNDVKSKKSHIKKPLNAFMLFMKEQRGQVVRECTLRESAAINQILGRKWHELDRHVQQKYYDMARDERLKHIQLYPGWSARDNYGSKKNRGNKGKKKEKNQECLNQKKCRARFGLDQQVNWCKHCKRKKKCLRYIEGEVMPVDAVVWSGEDDTDNIDDSDDCDSVSMIECSRPSIHTGLLMDFNEENKSRLLKYQQIFNSNKTLSSNEIPITMAKITSKKNSSSSQISCLQSPHHYSYFDSLLSTTSMPMSNEFKQEI